jgi:hypothetical protein
VNNAVCFTINFHKREAVSCFDTASRKTLVVTVHENEEYRACRKKDRPSGRIPFGLWFCRPADFHFDGISMRRKTA